MANLFNLRLFDLLKISVVKRLLVLISNSAHLITENDAFKKQAESGTQARAKQE